ncbi:hypothetical protein AGR7B_Cc50253 [Agrobacterium deltaense RV3]|nr:hypothetical protein AGR7B_Cc50253 [Agrobacterium deltaense RV3]
MKNTLNSISSATIVYQLCILNHVSQVMYLWLKNLLIFILLLRTLLLRVTVLPAVYPSCDDE